jgi:inward rectifier potassium channel
LTGIDETFSQTVHARSSYKFEEIFWNARFRDLFIFPEANKPLRIDIARFHDIERLS